MHLAGHPRARSPHRCGGALAPENTLAGLRKAAELGYRAVEFDVMLSADGTPVLIHDETLERTTDGHGRVDETSDAELARLDAGSRHGAQFAGEPVPSFGDAAELCLALGLWANVEIKPSVGHETETGRRVALETRDLWSGLPPPLLSSFSLEALTAAREAVPELPRGLLVEAPPADWLGLLRRLDCISLHCRGYCSVRSCSAKRARPACRCSPIPSMIPRRPRCSCTPAWPPCSPTGST